MCFGGKSPQPSSPPPPPPAAPIQGNAAGRTATNNATLAAQTAAGYSSTQLTGPAGVPAMMPATGKTLLGGT